MSLIPTITNKELATPIKTKDAEVWVQSLLKRYHVTRESRDFLIQRKGVTNEIIKELIPLSKYCSRKYSCEGYLLKFYPGSEQSFDAEIIKDNGDLVERIEVTLAIDGYQNSIQAEALVEFGTAPMFRTPLYEGVGRKRRLLENSEYDFIDNDEWINKLAVLIQKSYNKKHGNIHKYPETTLLIGVDIALASNGEASQVLSCFTLSPNTFEKVYCVNISGLQLWELK